MITTSPISQHDINKSLVPTRLHYRLNPEIPRRDFARLAYPIVLSIKFIGHQPNILEFLQFSLYSIVLLLFHGFNARWCRIHVSQFQNFSPFRSILCHFAECRPMYVRFTPLFDVIYSHSGLPLFGVPIIILRPYSVIAIGW